MNEEKIVNMFTDLKELIISKVEAINYKLISFEEKLTKLEERLAKLEERFNKHEEEQRLNFAKLEKGLNELEERFNKHEEEQRLNFVKLEDALFERTGALFDGYEVNKDSHKKFEGKIKSIYNILDRYAYRIEKLESKVK